MSGSFSPLTEHKNLLTKSDDLFIKEIFKRTLEEAQVHTKPYSFCKQTNILTRLYIYIKSSYSGKTVGGLSQGDQKSKENRRKYRIK
jgi:hypothetical protein